MGWTVHLFHGQLKPAAKDAAVEAFRDGQDHGILLSTEAGGEGRNFQFCHLLVNYDLPWNPMRVEQRIGRVDRIGQDHVVQVFNFWVKGTIEERVLDVLERRINVFEQTVGGLDPILGRRREATCATSSARRRPSVTARWPKFEERVRAAGSSGTRGRGEAARLHHGDEELLAGRSPNGSRVRPRRSPQRRRRPSSSNSWRT